MAKTRAFLVCALPAVLTLFSCKTAQKSVRFDPVLDSTGDLVVSNIMPQPLKIQSAPGDNGIEFDYAFLVRNVGKKTNRVLLDQSKLLINDKPATQPSCKEHDSKSSSPVSLNPRDTRRIDCHVQVLKDRQNNVDKKDSVAILQTPTSESKILKLKFYLSLEDFR